MPGILQSTRDARKRRGNTFPRKTPVLPGKWMSFDKLRKPFSSRLEAAREPNSQRRRVQKLH